MATPGSNPHKKGEHVFNDISGSIENSLESVLSAERVKSVALVQRFGPLRVGDLTQTNTALDRIRRDPILIQARAIVAPATGLHNDANSRSYSQARLKLEAALAELVVNMATLIWKKRPRSDSSFHEFESVIVGMRTVAAMTSEANAAFDSLVDSAHDLQAEASALSERTSDAELLRRRNAILLMENHRQALKQAGDAILKQFLDDIEAVLERRIGAA